LGIGRWNEVEVWPIKWLRSSKNIKILGIDFYPTIAETLQKTYEKIKNNVRGLLINAENRVLTIPQKILYFNTFVMPVMEYASKIFPLPIALTKYVQSFANTFIWRRKTEAIKITEVYNTYLDGGFNLINTKSKCNALFLSTLVNQLLQKNKNTTSHGIEYFIGIRVTFLKEVQPGPHQVNTNQIFTKAINLIRNLHKENPNTDWHTITTKQIYNILLTKLKTTPKIKLKNPLICYNNAFKNITNPFLSPTTREHVLFALHNILPTADRKQKCKQRADSNCHFCQQRETLAHLFECSTSIPAMKWLMRKLFLIDTNIKKNTINDLISLNFKLTPKKKNNSAIWLIGNFNLAIWKSRQKRNAKNITQEVTYTINRKIRLLRTRKNFKENFQIF